MTTTIAISTGQRKILERFKPGIRLMLDQSTGRYSSFEGDTITTVHKRPIEAMLRSGALEKDVTGRCHVKEALDVAGSLAKRKSHLADADGRQVACRYTKHPRARATWLEPAEFAKLFQDANCPDCATRLATLNLPGKRYGDE